VLKLGLRLELYRSPTVQIPYDLVRRAEELGFHSVWTAEAYGADALTPLAAIAARTERIKLGTAVVQLAGRPPAMLGMQAMTIDAIAGGGRMIVGIGLSGPQIVEGWYGQPWGKPNARLRDYVEILRDVLRREGPVTHDGPEISLPFTGPGALGQGKPLKSILHAPSDIPIWLASVGPKNTALCAELCDGWLPMGLPPASRAARPR
jgi:F420-dependent oxidoreductase-like protein